MVGVIRAKSSLVISVVNLHRCTRTSDLAEVLKQARRDYLDMIKA